MSVSKLIQFKMMMMSFVLMWIWVFPMLSPGTWILGISLIKNGRTASRKYHRQNKFTSVLDISDMKDNQLEEENFTDQEDEEEEFSE